MVKTREIAFRTFLYLFMFTPWRGGYAYEARLRFGERLCPGRWRPSQFSRYTVSYEETYSD